jgi:hypothetical protein
MASSFYYLLASTGSDLHTFDNLFLLQLVFPPQKLCTEAELGDA